MKVSQPKQLNISQTEKCQRVIRPPVLPRIRPYNCMKTVQTPGAQLTYFNDGGRGSTESYFIPTSEFVYPKKITPLFSIPKKSLRAFFATQKNPSVFFATHKKSRRLSLTENNHIWP